MKTLFDKMFEAQRQFQTRLVAFVAGKSWRDPQTGNSVDGTTINLIDNAVMAMAECVEILNELPWKKHKQEYGRSLTPAELTRVRKEVDDLQTFVVNLYLLVGVDSEEDVEHGFMAKHAINNERQDKGY